MRDRTGKRLGTPDGVRDLLGPGRWEFNLSEELDDQPPGAWDALAESGSLFLRPAFLKVVERAGPVNLQPCYATVLRDGRPVAAVSAQRIELAGKQLRSFLRSLEGSPRSSGAVQRIAISGLRNCGARVLVCGSALSCGLHGIMFRQGEDPALMWHAVVEALERIRDADDLTGATDVLLVKDVPPDLPSARDALTARGYRPIDNEPNMVLPVDPSWKTHRDYLSSMASKYRRSFEKVLRRVEESGYRTEPLDDIASCASELHRLYLHLQRRAKLRPVALPEEFLPTLAEALGESFRCMVLRDGAERLVGFVTVIHDGDTAVGYFMGYDPKVNRIVPVYLRLLHAVVEEALRAGRHFVSFGRTALDPKARLGAEPVPLSVWVRHQQPSLHTAIERWLPTALFEKVPTRRPFG